MSEPISQLAFSAFEKCDISSLKYSDGTEIPCCINCTKDAHVNGSICAFL